MTLPNKSEILKLNTISGGRPTTLPIAPRGGSQTNLNSISGGLPIFVIGGLNFNGFVKVSGVFDFIFNLLFYALIGFRLDFLLPCLRKTFLDSSFVELNFLIEWIRSLAVL